MCGIDLKYYILHHRRFFSRNTCIDVCKEAVKQLSSYKIYVKAKAFSD